MVGFQEPIHAYVLPSHMVQCLNNTPVWLLFMQFIAYSTCAPHSWLLNTWQVLLMHGS